MFKEIEVETMAFDRWSSRRRAKKARIYIWPKGESIMENLQNRRDRPHTAYRKEVLPTVFQKLGLDPATKVRWSQYAGCSCPCSPGFIVESYPAELIGRDVSVTVS